jgi:uncharacterized protein (DUF433 family)
MTLLIEPQTIPITKDTDDVFRVGNTRVTLETIVQVFENGKTAEEIAQQFPVLEQADIYAVNAYYLRHREQVKEYLQERAQLTNEMRQQTDRRYDAQDIRERLPARCK